MSLSLLKQSLNILEEDSAHAESEQTNGRTAKRTCAKHSKQWETKNKQTKKIGDIKNEIKQSNQKSKENLRKLLALSKNTLKNVDAEKIVKRAHKGLHVEVKPGKSKEEVESIFTDDDFRAFEEEYFAAQ